MDSNVDVLRRRALEHDAAQVLVEQTGGGDNVVEPCTPVETRAWYTVGFAVQAYSSVAISGFLPLLAQSAALVAAGFPGICQNIISDPARIAQIFHPVAGKTNVTSMYYIANFPGVECDEAANPTCIGDYCQGVPTSTSDCRLADGLTLQLLRTGGGVNGGSGVDPTSYATIAISVSVLVQVSRVSAFVHTTFLKAGLRCACRLLFSYALAP
jgi:hypothetical protein